MIQSRIDKAMKTILLIVAILASSAAVWGGELGPVEDNGSGSISKIQGGDVDLIKVAFNAYLHDKENDDLFSETPSLRKIKYHWFLIEKKDDVAFVGIHFDFVKLRKELKVEIRGGGVQYEINRKDFSIRKRLYYK
jgi:hypothetical protein